MSIVPFVHNILFHIAQICIPTTKIYWTYTNTDILNMGIYYIDIWLLIDVIQEILVK